MKLENQRKEAVYKYDIECTPEEETRLKAIAIERFALDGRAQLEYAMISLLTDLVENLASEDVEKDKQDNKIKKITKKRGKNGSKNNNRK